MTPPRSSRAVLYRSCAADLILVDGNPLKDVTNAAKRAGVMLRGRWLPESELARMLDAIAASYKTANQ